MLSAPHIILGVDPGTLVMGYGLILIDKSKISLVEMGVLHLHRHADHAVRLEMIYRKMDVIIRQHKPQAVAIEAPFFGKNVQSMLKLGRAQGVAIAAAMMHGLNAAEYAPRKIKQSITGNGNATKEQVWTMLQRTLQFDEDPAYMDATDAVAVALTHHYTLCLPYAPDPKQPTRISGAKKRSDWASYIKAHPEKLD